ncbi:MAG: alpha/beta fold hydrolase, partial [Burkholderiales bacterium]|nr:alpha/beta fold hydrolase [Burkholderiales bacterium]
APPPAQAGHPARWHTALEPRALFEIALLPWLTPALLAAPQGDGHPVLLLPGFLGSEFSLVALQVFLRSRGYAVQTWGLGRNVGFHARHAQALKQRIRRLHRETGRKVSLVGWSLGGVFALYGAHEAGACVRSVVTLGSPVTVDLARGSQAAPFVQAIYRLISHPRGPSAHAMQPHARKLRERDRPAMPVSCLYSISDGVVPAQEATMPRADENIRVPGSHLGLAFNAAVLWIVADRLAQAEGDWRPFEPSGPLGYVYRMLTHPALPL